MEKNYFSNKGVWDIVVEKKIQRTEDFILTSEGRELGMHEAWCNPKGDKGNLI